MSKINPVNPAFVSRKAELSFYLTKTDGKTRSNGLGITETLYHSRDLAGQWYRTILSQIEGDSEAVTALGELYSNMIDVRER